MKNIEKWLIENGFEYSLNNYGNGIYFDDNFSVPGISVVFYFDECGNKREKKSELENYMSRKRTYICSCSRFGAGMSYRIMSIFDTARLKEHEKCIADATEKFWTAEHEKRSKKAGLLPAFYVINITP